MAPLVNVDHTESMLRYDYEEESTVTINLKESRKQKCSQVPDGTPGFFNAPPPIGTFGGLRSNAY